MHTKCTLSHAFLGAAVVLLLVLNSCATTQISVPPSVMAVNPVDDCQALSSPKAWNIKAELIKVENIHYLVVDFNPTYKLTQPPQVQFDTGFVIFEGQQGNRYYYKITKFNKGVWLGSIRFHTDEMDRRGRMKHEVLRMQQVEGTNCIKLL